MANGWLLEQEIDLSQPISRQYTSPYGIALTGDDRAQRLRYTVFDGQDDADLSGAVKVYYRRPDDTLIESTSGGDYVTVEDNTITAELPPEAYEQKGTVECLVKLYASDGKIVTLARCDIEVLRGVENDETIIPVGEASRASLEDRVAALEVASGVVPIDQLPTLPHNPQSGDYLEIEDGNGPYKIDYEALADAIISRAAANNLITTVEGKLLDARQGKSLNDTKLNKANVYNGLDKTVAGYALDARQGKALKDTTDALAASVSDVYDSTATYAVGDYCIHDDSLYKCITAIPTAEAWDATHWTAVTVTDAITQSTATGGAGYFKSPDGTLMQWGVVDSTGRSGMEVNFSLPFVGNPNVYMTPYYNAAASIRAIYAATPTSTKFTLTAYDTSTGAVSTATNLNFRWLAIGRWK